jgi:hypothetical protein
MRSLVVATLDRSGATSCEIVPRTAPGDSIATTTPMARPTGASASSSRRRK